MKILITGYYGQLGKALQKELVGSSHDIFGFGSKELDIRSMENVKAKVLSLRPDVIINCAAHTKVDLCEEDMENAYAINAIGAQNLAMAAEEIGAKLVHISTDYVFDGESPLPRREDDMVNPQGIYGKSKRYGEELVQKFCSRYFVIRTAWLYGDGNNFVRTMLKLAKTNDKLTVVGDQFGSPTYTKDLAQVILSLMETEYYGVYHGTCQGECSWYDFACRIFEEMNLSVTVEKVTGEQFVRPAKRPKYSVLDNFMLRLRDLDSFRSWEEALKDYLREDKVWRDSNL